MRRQINILPKRSSLKLGARAAQSGFAMMISLILMIIITMMGFSASSKGKILERVTQTSVRYEEVFSVTEAEMYRLMNILQQTTREMPAGQGMDIKMVANREQFASIWSNKALAAEFNNVNLPDFSDFNNKGWEQGELQIIDRKTLSNSNNINVLRLQTDQGQIRTNGFVQELVKRVNSNSDGTIEYQAQYLVTVRGYALNQSDLDPSNAPIKEGQRRETVVLQSVYELSYISR